MNISQLNKNLIKKGFSKSAKSYDQYAALQYEVGQRMLARLQFIRIQPQHVLDIGCGTGAISQQLAIYFNQASVFALDLSTSMLKQAVKREDISNLQLFTADMDAIPLANQSIDMIFCNFTLQWSCDLEITVKEIRRILKPNGLLMFSTLGPETLYELRRSWAAIDQTPHVNLFMDMHDVGDSLLRHHFYDVVLDVENFTLRYPTAKKLIEELRGFGSHNNMTDRKAGLTTPRQLHAMLHYYEQNFKNEQELIPATYEVVYGHAWANDNSTDNQDKSVNTFKISPYNIHRR